ncbi:hypothetical protein M9H77_13191 [Catharanthus roseus]|uniref:Uncharacterized protein n=1 Tax=Catharanthus roseus TaxID=4058 RepID=A0ACC0BJT3_CATRO|nr:hypothetical protein M9H77_13191 [Catharanthus roseus]
MPFLVRPSQPENLYVSYSRANIVPIGSKCKSSILGNNPRQVRLSMFNGSQSQRNFTRTKSMPFCQSFEETSTKFSNSSLPSNSVFRPGMTLPIWWICSFRLNGPGCLTELSCLEGIFDRNLFTLNNFRHIFDFEEASLNSNSSVSITPSQSTTTITDSSIPLSGTQGSYAAIFEDHLALNSSSGRIVELHCSICKQLGQLMPNKNSQDVLVAAEALHGESNEIPFLEHLLEDLTNNGVAGEAFWDTMDLVGIVASSPLEQFTILLGFRSYVFCFFRPLSLIYSFLARSNQRREGSEKSFLFQAVNVNELADSGYSC